MTGVEECGDYWCHMYDLAEHRSKHAKVVEQLDQVRGEQEVMKNRHTLLGVCTAYPALRLELEQKNTTIRTLQKSEVASPPTVDCTICLGLLADMDELRVGKTNQENENTYLRAIPGWVSSRGPQLGIMIQQFMRGNGFGVGYEHKQSDFDHLYGKIG